jgi:hypothetical protein
MTQSVASAATAFAVMASEPTTVGFQSSYHGNGSVMVRWELSATDGHNPGSVIEYATLSVFHFGAPTKAYVASLNRTRVTVAEEGALQGELSSPMRALKVTTLRTARYNRKAHVAFAQQVVEDLRAGTYPDAAQMFDVEVSASR